MKMSKENYNKLKSFFDYLVETANDEVAEYYINTLIMASEVASDALKKVKNNGKN